MTQPNMDDFQPPSPLVCAYCESIGVVRVPCPHNAEPVTVVVFSVYTDEERRRIMRKFYGGPEYDDSPMAEGVRQRLASGNKRRKRTKLSKHGSGAA